MKRLSLLLLLLVLTTGIGRAYQSTLDWQNIAVTPQSGTFTMSFNFAPQQAGMDGFVGVSHGSVGAYNEMACSVRVFRQSGTTDRFEAFDAGGYAADVTIPYTAGQVYQVVMSIDVIAEKYSVTINGVSLAQGFDFRTAYTRTGALDNVVIKHLSGSYILDGLALGGGDVPTVTGMPVYEKVASFTGMQEAGPPPGDNKGYEPADLIHGPDGYLYGSTDQTIFKVSLEGSLQTLVEGPGLEDKNPTLSFLGYDGNLYGFTSNGGEPGLGTVFKMTRTGNLTTLVEFTGTAGAKPGSDPCFILQLTDGSIVGLTRAGGAGGHGTVFRISAAGAFTPLRTFTGNSGINPGRAPVLLVDGRDARIYGVTAEGGAANLGVAFGMSVSGAAVFTKSFTGETGLQPGAKPEQLMLSEDGSLYGTTAAGGTGDFGTVYKLTKSGDWALLAHLSDHFGNENRGDYYPLGFLPLIEVSSGKIFAALKSSWGGVIYEVLRGGGLEKIQEITHTDLESKVPENAFWGSLRSFTIGSNGMFWIAADLEITTFMEGGAGCGAVFSMTESGEVSFVHALQGDVVDQPEGADPGYLLEARDGSIYGTTARGGEGLGGDLGSGTIFRINAAGTWETVVHFGVPSYPFPRQPCAAAIQGSDGYLYGTSRLGGEMDYGTVFKMSLSGELVFTRSFTGNIRNFRSPGKFDGIYPTAELFEGEAGKFYGMTGWAAALLYDAHYPTHFTLSSGGETDVLTRSFPVDYQGDVPGGGFVRASDGNVYVTNLNDGFEPSGCVLKVLEDGSAEGVTNSDGSFAGFGTYGNFTPDPVDASGTLFGVCSNGGTLGHGNLFRVIPGVSTTSIFSFNDSAGFLQGRNPLAGLMLAQDGKLYGTTAQGGAFGKGVLYRISKNGTGFEKLADFTGMSGSLPGALPLATLTQTPDGDIFGTTSEGGAGNYGTIFRRSASGAVATVFDFSGDPLDSQPLGRLVLCSDGNLYGTTAGDGGGGVGGVFRLIFQGAPSIYPSGGAPLSPSQYRIAAKLNARGSPSSAVVRFGTDPGLLGSLVPVNLVSSFAGYRTTDYAVTLAGLASGVTYYYRLESTNSRGTSTSEIFSFVTSGAPSATLGTPDHVTTDAARIPATVNARNSPTTIKFEYGLDGVTFPFVRLAEESPLSGSGEVSVEVTLGDLMPGTMYHVRVRAENAVGSAVDGARTFTTLIQPDAITGVAERLSTTRATVHGQVMARGTTGTAYFEYREKGTSGTPPSAPASPSTLPDGVTTEVSAVLELPSDSQGKTFEYRVVATIPSGSTTLKGEGIWREFTLSILSGLDQAFPPPLAAPGGALTVNLSPPGVGSWRLAGELEWRASGTSATGLATGSRTIEFRPVPGRFHPAELPVFIDSTEPPLVIGGEDGEYLTPAVSPVGEGALQVILEPAAVRNAANAPRWHFPGDDAGLWRASGGTRSNLIPGNYLIQCEDHGDWLPPSATVEILPGETATRIVTLVFTRRSTETGTGQSPVGYATFASNETLPLAYVGQLRSPTGHASGFAVKSKVVATAGHVVWDDNTKAAISGLQWLFQRDAGVHEPVPLEPRGYFLASGYAAEREKANVIPGQGTPESQHHDYAALYFTQDLVARGGFSGFLASEGGTNEFLTANTPKILAGYSTDIANPALRGRLHATPFNSPLSFALQQVPGIIEGGSYGTYTTGSIYGRAGSSGGPLFAKHQGKWYPAGIFLGGTTQTVVRAIDRAVVDLFGKAETRANGGGNSHDGGRAFTVAAGGTSDRGSLKVVLLPANLNAKWKLSDSIEENPSPHQRNRISPATYAITLLPVAGYLSAGSQTVTIDKNTLTTFTYTYRTSQQQWRYDHFGSFDGTGDFADGADPDHDGRTNLDEYSAGTNPTNASDFFRILAPTCTASGFSVTVAGKKDRTYLLESRGELLPGPWAPHQTIGPLNADQPSLILTAPPSSDPRRFYRVQVTAP